MPNVLFEFGPFRFDPIRQMLLRDGEPVQLRGKACELLQALVEQHGEVLDKDELMKRLWPDTEVEENNLTVQMTALRKALGDPPNEHRYIITLPGRGYRFVAEVRKETAEPETPEVIVAERTRTSQEVEEAEETLVKARPSLPALSQAHFFTRSRRRLLLTVSLALGLVILFTWKLSQSPRTTSGLAVRSLAVLPFQPLKAGDSQGHLELGVTDALITRLSNLRQIVVRPTSAVLKYASIPADPLAAGRELGVDALLDGRIQQDGDRLRVTAQLLRVRDGHTLWAETFDARFTDIFAVEDAISRQIAQTLTFRLSGEEQRQLTKHETENAEAYRLYIKGVFHTDQLTSQGFKQGLACLNQALALDPNYARVYAGLAFYYINAEELILPPHEAMPRARETAQRALALNETLGEAHVALARIYDSYDWDWAAAEREYKRAIELTPNSTGTRQQYSAFLRSLGRFQEAAAQLQQAEQMEPLSLWIISDVGLNFYFERRYDQAIQQFRSTIEMDPNHWLRHLLLGRVYEQKGQLAEAIAAYQKARSIDETVTESLMDLGRAYALAGQQDEARKVLEELQKRSQRGYVAPFYFANIYLGLGEKEKAFVWLEKAYEARSWYLTWLKVDPALDRLRNDPRFADLQQRIGLEK